jgi:uncharacterized protein (TIGR02186 family)
MVRKHTLLYTICLIFMLLFNASSFSAESQDSLTVVPDLIEINTFYHGARVKVLANVGSCDNAVIILEGQDEEVTLNKKGRVGIIWMNIAQITISGLPEVYIYTASDELDSISSPAIQEKLGLGLKSLRPRMEVHSDQPLTGNEFDQFVKLKTRVGTYSTDNKIELRQLSTGGMELSSELPIPSHMPPGKYDIHLYCFNGGKMIKGETAFLEIKRIGLPQLMINLANNHPAAYGLVAILVAMAVGLLMGVIFSSLPGKGH